MARIEFNESIGTDRGEASIGDYVWPSEPLTQGFRPLRTDAVSASMDAHADQANLYFCGMKR